MTADELRPRSLRRNFSATATGGLVYAACQFGMLSILARFTTPAEVGRYALALAISGPVFAFANLKLRDVLATDAVDQFAFGQYLGQRIVTSAVAVVAIAATALLLGLDEATLVTVLAVTAFKAFESVIDLLYGAMQRREQMHLIARSEVWRGVGGLLVFGALVVWTRRVEVASIGLAVCTAPQIATNTVRLKRLGISARPLFNRSTLRRLTWLALPLGVSIAAGSLRVNVPRYFLQAFEGSVALGIFAALAYVLVLSGTVVGALGQAASPRLANLFAAGQRARFTRTLTRLVALGAALGVAGVAGAALFGAPALRLVFGAEYAAHADVLVVLMVAAAVQYSVVFLGTSVTAIRRFTVQMPISIGVLIVVTAAAAVAVPPWGLMGGALAVLASQVFAMLCYIGLYVRVVLPALRPAGGEK
ncbi:oligosaccharide flippase family protein [Pseudonocardia lacus]|uniref:oligosaccharide flippase family protein n=1 Tax=Pseudonocardia lacus TaxID=2835865 RepID=UPI001BDD1D7A|nr:oligosaccharide flippase family protein [Pseudonocardia lacus]